MDTSRNLMNSALATVVAEVVTLPVCTVKTRYQNTASTSISGTLHEIISTDGYRALFRASAPAILAQVVSTSSKYTLYREFDSRKLLGDFSCRPLNGMVSGMLTTVLTHPIDSIRVHMQMGTLPRTGILYRGYSKSLSKVIVGSSLFFPLYDTVKDVVGNPTLSGIASSMIATTAIHPLDYLKTRHIAGLPCWLGWKPSVYFKGLSLNLGRVVPHFTIVVSIVDYLKE